MTWLNRGFKIRHKFTKEKEMKAEAIRALEQFKQMHLAREVTNEQADIVSESSHQGEVIMREPRTIEIALPTESDTSSRIPSKQKGVNFNYPDHIKPLKNRIMTALNNGARTADTIAKYCKEGEKLVNLQLGRWVSRGMIGRKVSESGIIRFYPHDIAKQMGILVEPQPINRMGKKAKGIEKKRSSPSFVQPKSLQKWDAATAPSVYTAEFLEKRVVEWQNEARRLANENEDLKAKLSQAQVMLIEARKTRDVTSEVTEVMKEVMDLRATVAYLESKLFGSK